MIKNQWYAIISSKAISPGRLVAADMQSLNIGRNVINYRMDLLTRSNKP